MEATYNELEQILEIVDNPKSYGDIHEPGGNCLSMEYLEKWVNGHTNEKTTQEFIEYWHAVHRGEHPYD